MTYNLFKFVSLIFVSIFVFHLASAYILLSQPSSSYNLGDNLLLNITVHPSLGVDNFLTADLICTNGDVNLYKNSFNLLANNETSVNLSIVLNNAIIGDLNGSCYINSNFGSDESETQVFQISNQINLILNVSNYNVYPSGTVTVSGTAIKSDNNNVNGLADVYFQDTNLNITSQIVNGNFSSVIFIPQNISAGYHYLSVSAYEFDSQGDMTNQGYLLFLFMLIK